MKFKDIFLTASANMFRSKLRTFLTIIAIFIGAFTLTLTNGLGSGISSYIDKQVSNLGQKDLLVITPKSTDDSGESDQPKKYEPGKSVSATLGQSMGILTKSDVDTLKADADIKDVQPGIALNPDYIEGNNGQKYQVTRNAQVGPGAHLDLAAGKELDVDSTADELVLPLDYVSVLGFGTAENSIGKTVTIAVSDAFGKQHTVQATVIGVQQKGLVGGGAVFSNPLTDKLYDLQSEGLPAASKDKYIYATATIVGDLSDTHVSDIKSKLSKLGYSALTAQDKLGTFKSVVNAIIYVLDAFAIIALLAASFGIVNTLLMSVQERTKEIGLMKAMGMRSSGIFLLFSIEAMLIGFWGSLVGVGVAILVGRLANHVASNGILKDLPGFDLLTFPIQSIAIIILLIMAIAFLAGTLPARRAAKQNPIDALRYE